MKVLKYIDLMEIGGLLISCTYFYLLYDYMLQCSKFQLMLM